MTTPVVAIIEDDTSSIAVITDVLGSEGFQTFQWRKADGAYEVIKENHPSAVILDMRMEHPRAGLAVLERLRTDRTTAGIPVLVCTADHEFAREWREPLTQQRCAVLTKPFLIDDLLHEVRSLVAPPMMETGAIPLPPTVQTIEAAAVPAAELRKQIIALVDDTGRDVTRLADSVDAKGYAALPWRWGNGLHAMIARDRPDLVIMDVPAAQHRALWRAVRQIQRDPEIGQTPFILLTEGAPRFPTPMGRCTLVFKPFERRALYGIVAELIGPPPVLPPQPPRRQRRPPDSFRGRNR
jgi:CheY-like chemotaxis protein